MTEVDLIKELAQSNTLLKVMYDGVVLNDIVRITGVTRKALPTRENTLIGRHNISGSRLRRSRLSHSTVVVDFAIIGTNISIIRRRLASFLNKSTERKLEFSDEPGVYYNAVVEGEVLLTEEATVGKGSITFLLPDPFAYSLKEKPATRVNNILTFQNEGTAECYPVFEFQAKSDVSMFGLTHPNGRGIQYGYDDGVVRIKSGQQVKINTADCSVYVAGQRRYPTELSRSFAIQPGEAKIAYAFNKSAVVADVTGTFREAWL